MYILQPSSSPSDTTSPRCCNVSLARSARRPSTPSVCVVSLPSTYSISGWIQQCAQHTHRIGERRLSAHAEFNQRGGRDVSVIDRTIICLYCRTRVAQSSERIFISYTQMLNARELLHSCGRQLFSLMLCASVPTMRTFCMVGAAAAAASNSARHVRVFIFVVLCALRGSGS